MAFTISALIIAIIFVIVMEKYFNITLKNPVGRIPKMKDPMRRN